MSSEPAPGSAAAPLDAAIGLSYRERADGGVVLRLDPTAAAVAGTEPVYLHGGAIGTCVDTAAWQAIVAERPGTWLAVDLRCDFLRLAGDRPHRVVGRCRRVGRTMAVADVEIAPWDDPERTVALGRATFLRVGD